ncbi:hypothetical protein [Ralstonia sp. A12]|nr:hypothetical protein [Ralstonia sp. A12]
MFFLSLLALCTQDVGEWGTRGAAQKTPSEAEEASEPTTPIPVSGPQP